MINYLIYIRIKRSNLHVFFNGWVFTGVHYGFYSLVSPIFCIFCGKGRSPASSGTRTVQDSKYGYTGQSL